MVDMTEVWTITNMGSVESKFKGGYSPATFSLWGALGPINPDKQFPDFKNGSNPSQPCRQNYITDRPIHKNSSPQPQEPVTKNNSSVVNNNNQMCNKKKKKKRKKKKKKNKNCQSQKPTVCVTTQFVIGNCNSFRRQRQLSTAESEDSFIICFEDNCEENDQISELSENETETVEDFDSLDSVVAHKKVRFADDAELCEVHPMIKWAYAYQAARKGPWEEYARDRDRFHQRVKNVEAEIGHVFSPEHRSKIYNERFS